MAFFIFHICHNNRNNATFLKFALADFYSTNCIKLSINEGRGKKEHAGLPLSLIRVSMTTAAVIFNRI